MTTSTLTKTNLRHAAIEMARQHRDAGVFLARPSLLLGLIDCTLTATEKERRSAWDAYRTVASSVTVDWPVGEQELADMTCWYAEEKWAE